MFLYLSINEAETLCKVLSDYKIVLLRRAANEYKRKDYRNIYGKIDFCHKFLVPMELKIKDALFNQGV